jgi:hypothetical protein
VLKQQVATPGKGQGGRKRKLSTYDWAFLYFFILRSACSYDFAAYLFNVSPNTVHRYFVTFAFLLDSFLDRQMPMPSIDVVKSVSPSSVGVTFTGSSDAAFLVGDSTCFYMQHSGNPEVHATFWSQYYAGEVLKTHSSCTLLGGVVHVSDAYGGSISDDDILSKCGILQQMEPGMVYLLDRGYLKAIYQASLAGVKVFTPAFLARDTVTRKNVAQLTSEQAKSTLDVASPRNVIERVYGRVKSTWPWLIRVGSAVSVDLRSSIIRSCLLLTNFFGPLSNAAAEAHAK